MRWIVIFNDFVGWYFAIAIFFYLLLISTSLVSSARYRRRLKAQVLRTFLKSPITPPVAVLVPTHNEEGSIVETVRSLLQLKYPAIELIVINDGSTDQTLSVLTSMFGLIPTQLTSRPDVPCASVRGVYISIDNPALLVIDKEQGGKSDALNAGLNFARSPYFCAIDADTVLEGDALMRVMAPMLSERSKILASGGIVRVANGSRIEGGQVREVHLPYRGIEVLQVVEYLRGFLFGREGWSALNSLLIVSGAFGVFSRELTVRIGGYRCDTVGEDMDLVVRMHRAVGGSDRRYRILFVPDPIAWTEVPSDLRSLARQRRRWQRGLFDVLWRSRKMMFNPRYGRVGLIGFPYQVFVELLSPVIEFAGTITIGIAAILGVLDRGYLIFFLLFAYLLGSIISLASVLLEELTYRRYNRVGELLRLLLFAFLEFFPYRQFLIFCRIWGMGEYVFSGRLRLHWGKQRRVGFQPAVASAGNPR